MPRPPADHSLARELLDKPDELARVLDRFMRQTGEAFAVKLLGDSAQAQLHRFNVTVPVDVGPVYAQYFKSAAQAVVPSVNTPVAYDLLVADNRGAISGGVFTVPAGEDGLYQVSGSIALQGLGAGKTMLVELWKNGALAAGGRLGRTDGTPAGILQLGGSATLSLVAGNTVLMNVLHNDVANRNTENGFFTVAQVERSSAMAPRVPSCWPYEFACVLARAPSWVGIGELREQSSNRNVVHGGVDWEYVVRQTAAGPVPHIRVRNVPLLPSNRSYRVTLLALWE